MGDGQGASEGLQSLNRRLVSHDSGTPQAATILVPSFFTLDGIYTTNGSP